MVRENEVNDVEICPGKTHGLATSRHKDIRSLALQGWQRRALSLCKGIKVFAKSRGLFESRIKKAVLPRDPVSTCLARGVPQLHATYHDPYA